MSPNVDTVPLRKKSFFIIIFKSSHSLCFRSFYGKTKKAFIPVALPDINVSDDGLSSDDDEDIDYAESSFKSDTSSDSEDESDPDDNIPLANFANYDINIAWNNGSVDWPAPSEEDLEQKDELRINPNMNIEVNRFTNPIEFFKLFVNDEIFEHITFQTDLYNTHCNLNNGSRKVKDVSIDEIKTVIGVVLMMGIIKLPQRRMYWQPSTSANIIADAITFNRFGEILRILHFNDNSLIPNNPPDGYNKCYKIQPLIDMIRKQLDDVVLPETYISIDEQMVPFKGRSALRRYLPKKPKKWGYKLWAMAGGVSGFIYDFEVNGGEGSKGPPPLSKPPSKCGESDFVVLRLANKLEADQHVLFFDNYFCSPELMAYLQRHGMKAVATLNRNRSRDCPLPSKRELTKAGRGAITEVVDSTGRIVVTSWNDNKPVLMLSNVVGKEPTDTCKRFDRKKKEIIEVPRPASVAIYNKFMGGVDKADILLSIYRTKFRSRKWYLRIAFHLMSLCATNAWLLYKQIGGKDPLLKFLISVSNSLIQGKPTVAESDEWDLHPEPRQKSLKRSQVPTDMRFDKYNHWPTHIECKNAQRCKLEHCTRKTRFQCSKCNVYLCVNGSPCFTAFHMED